MVRDRYGDSIMFSIRPNGWQILAYRNPVLQLRPYVLVFYGIAIPWTAIKAVYVGNVNLTPSEPRSFTYRFARAISRRQDGQLLLRLVKECSVSDLARE